MNGDVAALVYRIVHRTTYSYALPMTDGYTVAHLIPRSTPWQGVLAASVTVDPEPDVRDERVDPFGNVALQLGLHRPHSRLELTATSVVSLDEISLPAVALSWEQAVEATAAIGGEDALEVSPFVAASPFVDLAGAGDVLAQLVRGAFAPGLDVLDAIRAWCGAIFHGFEFDPVFSDVSTPVATVVAARRGVCQDFAHLAIAGLRSVGLAARYVSGYIETNPPPGQPRSIGADASHAWCSVWVPGGGWVDVDPTNDQMPTRRHVTVAWGRDYGDVTPVRGVVIGPGAHQTLDVSVDVERIEP